MKNDQWSVSKKVGVALGACAAVIIVSFSVGAFVAAAQTFEKFPEEFFIGGVAVGGKTAAEAQRAVDQRAAAIVKSGVSVTIPNAGTYQLPIMPDFINAKESIAAAKNVVQRGALLKQIRSIVGAAARVDVAFELAEDTGSRGVTSEILNKWEAPLKKPTDARFEIVDAVVRVIPSSNGESVNESLLAETLEVALAYGETHITAAVVEREPDITTHRAEQLLPQQQALAAELTKGRSVTIEGKSFLVSSADLITLLQPRVVDESVTVSIDPQLLQVILGKSLAPYEQEGRDAAFAYDGKKVTKFVAPQKGISVDWNRLATDLFASLSSTTAVVPVHTIEVDPKVPLSELNDLGIKEIIGIGRSNFSGSPKNRRHNIAVGVASLKNILIAPGQEFSLIKALGTIDGSTGYLQELVIKENKTIPEFGGGLCQIGTTTFRAAMGAGFPITERRNHSYQVRYYFENGVSGTDATIYDPKPDFRFKNDTGHWVLFDPRIKGDTLEFVFWGTSDGRVAKRTIPKILSTSAPPPKKMIETLDLPPGQIKCTEKPHAGASTIFTYTVEQADGTVKKQDFSSYYKPWGEVCLIGVAALSPLPGESGEAGTVTPPTTPTTPVATTEITPDAAGATGN